MQPTFHLLDDPGLRSLRSIGFSSQRFPRYINHDRTPHLHDVVELFLVVDGEATHLMDGGEEQPLTRGNLGVVNFGQSHAIVTDERGVDVVNVYIDPRWVGLPALSGELAAALPRILPLAPGMAHNLNRVTQYRLDEVDRMSAILRALADEADRKQPEHLTAMTHYMHLFVIECARFARQHFRHDAQAVPGPMLAVERVRRYLDENCREEMQLDDIATRARMSKAHLCRIFKLHTGRTIVEYLHHRRIECAMVMLNSSSEKIINIALESGFGDLAHFNHVFRRITGQTPSAFRRLGGRTPERSD